MSEVNPAKIRINTQKKRGVGIYMQNILTRKVTIPFNVVGSNLTENIITELSSMIDGKCVQEGYIKPDTIRLIQYSAGVIDGKSVSFTVVFECLVCQPVEGMKFKVLVKNITKAGVRCETKENPSPVVVFIARDHHYKNKEFAQLNVDDEVTIRVIGTRFELNDPYISVIAELVQSKKFKKKPIKLVIKQK
jgi:DNA-directed RNA polymerase subunit E'/Rpb7